MAQPHTVLRFKRTLARVVAADGTVTYRCTACVRRELSEKQLGWFQRGSGITFGAGMFRQEWVMVQGFQPCSVCEA